MGVHLPQRVGVHPRPACISRRANASKGLSPCVSLGLVRTGNAAVKTILRGEDANAAKPGPRLTAAKRRQIASVRKLVREARAAGKRMSILRACRKVWQDIKGGYPSAEALYAYCHSHRTEFSSEL